MSESKIPKTGQRGYLAMTTGNDDEVAWVPASLPSSGFITPLPVIWAELDSSVGTGGPVSAFGYTPSFMPVGAQTTAQLVEAVCWAKDTATDYYNSYELNITQNGTAIPALTNLWVSYSTSPVITILSPPVDIANNDEFNIEVTRNWFGGGSPYTPIIATLYIKLSAVT